MKNIVIGTRGSILALAQAESVKKIVEKGFLEKYEYNGQQGYKMTYKGIYPDDTRALYTHEIKLVYGE